jgi:hypothetical protein
MAGYLQINFWTFGLALAVVSLPVFFLRENNPRWAWAYVFLILLMLVTFYRTGVAAMANYFSRALKG